MRFLALRACLERSFLDLPRVVMPFSTAKASDFSVQSSCFLHSPSPADPSRRRQDPETLHATAVKKGLIRYPDFGKYILGLYVKYQNLASAENLFDEIPHRDVRTWTVLLSGFARVGSFRVALDHFKAMQIEGVCPNHFTLSTVLKCCSSLGELQLGQSVHGWILRNGIDGDAVLENSILDVYVKCGEIDIAQVFFEAMKVKESVAWNIMIGGYLKNGHIKKSLELFKCLPFKDAASWNTMIDGLMRNGMQKHALGILYEEELLPLFNEFTYSTALVLAASLGLLELGRQIHGHVVRVGIYDNGYIRTSLIDMYCKCGEVGKASRIVGNMPQRFASKQNSMMYGEDMLTEIVSYSALVSGYVHKGDIANGFRIFSTMVREHFQIDKFTITSIFYACAGEGMLELGRQVHAYVQKVGHEIDVPLCSALIDMYAKCGNVDDAHLMFQQASDSNVVVWTAMISGFAVNGKGREALLLFGRMINEGITPNRITFTGVLTACVHAGLIDEGQQYFRLMKEVYGIKPGSEHFTCIVDLYGRNGLLNEIKDFIYENGIWNLPSVWQSFLSSCQLHKNVVMGNWAFQKLRELAPDNPELHLLLSSVYAIDHRWEEAAEIWKQMQQRGLKKLPGQSWIQL